MKRTSAWVMLFTTACVVEKVDGGDVPSASALGCQANEVVQWTGTAWDCVVLQATPTPTPGDVPSAAALRCSAAQVVEWTGAGWGCKTLPPPGVPDFSVFGQCTGADHVTGIGADGHVQCAAPPAVDEATVDALVANNGYASSAELAAATASAGAALALATRADDAATAVGARVTAVETTAAALHDNNRATTLIGWADVDAPATFPPAAHTHSDLEQRLIELEEGLLCPRLTTRGGAIRRYRPTTNSPTNVIRCTAGIDEMVKVGNTWIDRYEAVVVDEARWSNGACNGAGTAYRSLPTNVTYPPTFEVGGRWTTPAYACSVAAVGPSGATSWFQAQQACALAGKRLCTNAEWTAAAMGTPDPTVPTNGAGGGPCNTNGAPRATRNAGTMPGAPGSCISSWGAEDMVGNLWEWVDGWESGIATAGASGTGVILDAARGTDVVFDVTGQSFEIGGDVIAYPAGVRRGGGHDSGTGAGIYALSVTHAPWRDETYNGFRCCAGGR